MSDDPSFDDLVARVRCIMGLAFAADGATLYSSGEGRIVAWEVARKK
jgi:hypothetical protein